MSRRRGRSRAVVVVSSDEEDEGQEEQPTAAVAAAAAAAGAAAPGPRASRRTALPLQLSQGAGATAAGTAGTAAGNGSASNALAKLLAGAAKSVPSGGSSRAAAAAGSGSQAVSGCAARPRRGGRAVATAAAAAAGAAGSRQQQAAEQGPAAAPAAVGAAGPQAGELWVEKHAPASEAELVVHKKKVQEVREWLEEQRSSLGRPGIPRLLVVSGPPGCGKSTVLTTLAAALGFDVSEWRPPSAVQREEAEYAGLERKSKLDEFNEFVARTKMPHLSLTSSGGSSGGGATRPASATAAAARGTQPAAASAQAAAGGAAAAVGGSQRPGRRLPPSLLPTLVVVDDLPHAAGPQQRQQIGEALADLAAGARFPVVVVATEMSGKAQQERGLSAAAGSYQGLHKDLIEVLEGQRATTISFNPFTPLNIAKALRGILEKERRVLPEADVQAIAEQANGDLHNAISTLQFVCTGVRPVGATAAAAAAAAGAKQRGRGTKRKAGAATAGGGEAGGQQQQQSQVGYALRDSALSLFHALGKLLYNKRLPAGSSQQQQQALDSSDAALQSQAQLQAPHQQQQQQQQQELSSKQPWTANGFWQAAMAAGRSGLAAAAPPMPVAAWAQRQPMEFDPEAVLAAAGLEAGSVSAFLHENVLHFVDDSAIEDAAGCLDQLSIADCMASGRRWGSGDALMADEDVASSTLLDAAAASTAARGVCFHNAHPAPRRWFQFKGPSVFKVQKGVAANTAELSRNTAAVWALHGGLRCLEPAGRLAADLLPYARAIAARSHDPSLQRLQPAQWTRFWDGKLYEQQQGGGGGRGGANGGWQQEQEELLPAGSGSGGGEQQQQQQAEDWIEESEDEDDW